MNYTKRYASIPSKTITLTDYILRVNKFGVHTFKNNTVKSISHEEFLNHHCHHKNKICLNEEAIARHILEHTQSDDEEFIFDANIRFTVHNHTYPVFKINSSPQISINNLKQTLILSQDNIDSSLSNRLEEIDPYCAKFFPNIKMMSKKYTFNDIKVPGNEYNFIFNDINLVELSEYTEHSILSGKYSRMKKNIYDVVPECTEKNFFASPYGTDGKRYETWCPSAAILKLELHIIPKVRLRRIIGVEPYLDYDQKLFGFHNI